MKKMMMILVLILAGNSWAWSQLDLVWDKTYPDSINIEFAKFSPDGKYIYVATNGNIKKMDALSGEFISSFYNRNVPIYYLNISKSGNYIISRDGGWGFDIWDLKLERIIKHYSGHYRNLFISNDDKYKIFVDAEGLIKITDFQSDSIVKQIQTHSIQSAVMSNNGKMIAIGSTYKKANPNGGYDEYQKLEIWDTDKLEVTKIIQDTIGRIQGYRDLDFSYGDSIVAFNPEFAYQVNFYNLITNKIEYKSILDIYLSLFTPDNSHIYVSKNGGFLFQKDYSNYTKYIGFNNAITTGGKPNEYFIFLGKLYKGALYKNSLTGITEPKTDKFNVSYSNNILSVRNNAHLNPLKKIIISDIQGKTIYQTDIEDFNNTNISINIQLNSGVYFAQIISDQVYSHKFQVTR